MNRDLTNFLPEDKKRAFRQLYLARVMTALVSMLLVVLFAHIALMFPTYLYVRQEYDVKAKRLADIADTTEKSKQEEVSKRITSLHANLERLHGFLAQPHSMPMIKSILAISGKGIHITSISSSSGEPQATAFSMRITGVADTREQLRAYQLSLSALPFVSSADLPLSAFAKEKDIPFSIAITGTTTP